MIPLRLLVLALASPLLGAPAFAEQQPADPEVVPWLEIVSSHLAEAHATFTDPDSKLSPRSRAFGEAVTLLNLQPRTASRIARATELLDSVAAGPADSLTVPALYLRARIDQVHLETPDIPSALRRYEELFAANPGHPLAQLGLSKAAMVRIYTDKNDPLGEPLTAAEAAAAQLTDSSARVAMHLMLANVCTRLGDQPRRALDHLESAFAAGILNARTRATTLVRIGVLSEEFDRPDRAIFAYERFLEEFERDDRAHTIRERLAALKEAAR